MCNAVMPQILGSTGSVTIVSATDAALGSLEREPQHLVAKKLGNFKGK